MASWNSISFKFDIFNPLKPPLEIFLSLLEVIEAILEAVLALLKLFLLDLLNPFAAIINALIAALRAIIEQIESSGFSLLLVHPDFSQADFSAVLNSVSGGYQGFETKVVSKFFDTADIFRPQYPPGSSVAMAVFYIEATDPSPFLALVMKLIQMFGQPIDMSLPAPVGVKTSPVKESGDFVGQFRNLFDSDLDQAVAIEWRMPEAPSGQDSSEVLNQMVAFYNSFRFPGFIIERTGPFPQDSGPQIDPNGDILFTEVESPTLGPQPAALAERYNFSKINTKTIITEGKGGIPLRFFPKVIDVSGDSLGEGYVTGSYSYIDDDVNLQSGKNYYYRVRAYFGDFNEYQSRISDVANKIDGSYKKDQNLAYVNFDNVTLGAPSPTVAGFVPRKIDTAEFDPYYDVLDAVRMGILLNFEFPSTYPAGQNVTDPLTGEVTYTPGPENSNYRNQQRAGWGTLGMLGGQVGRLKAGFSDAASLNDNYLFTITARRLANMITESIYDKPKMLDMLSEKWNSNVKALVRRFYLADSAGASFANDAILTRGWSYIGLLGGISLSSAFKIDAYLAKEESYKPGKSDKPLDGPLPLSPTFPEHATFQERLDLADFLRLAIGGVSGPSGYLVWQSVTVGDLFPALLPFMFQFEQFLLALLRAVNSALQAIIEIIETLLQKVQALKQIVQTLINIMDLLNISFSASILGVSGQGSAESLVSMLMQAEDKPVPSNSLYSGIVATAGGPGEGFVAAIKVILFLLTAGQVNL